ncbi:CPBP family intramembrane metalloprotease [Haloarcula sp. S1CR25-12]|uniref:CPBP family intramembrane metalloprotease n=1 Tax=Haloarcula saliterrae TaxID=2950534 RepID=A0ABU2FET3_9EURY|nr:CPBP family intramembrane glutamic endopeptidase [Haloarcula sp. S1CR25-12]MDS0260335.1 CPBP family intramembrane metalloprotease [Haloarcula sp. S1CR25-12]
MTELLWPLAILTLPVLLLGYMAGVTRLAQHLLTPSRTLTATDFVWLYVPFPVVVVGVYLATVRPAVPVFEPLYLVAVPVGAVLYYGTTIAWQQYTGEPIRAGHRSLLGVAPGLLLAFPEELLFRAGLAPLMDLVGPVGYTLVSAVAFGLYHQYLGRKEVVFKTLFGGALCVSYLLAGSVVVPMLVHFGYNLAFGLFVTGRGPVYNALAAPE